MRSNSKQTRAPQERVADADAAAAAAVQRWRRVVGDFILRESR